MDPIFGRTFRLSGAAAPTSFTLNVEVTADMVAANGLLNRNFQAATTSVEFAALVGEAFGPASSITSATPISQLRYLGEPGPGYHTAEQWVRLTVTSGGVPALQAARLSLVLDGGAWKLLSLDPPTVATVVSPPNMHGWATWTAS